MIVRRFLLWARSAGPGQRAQAVNALARAYLTAELSPDDRREAETALTAMLDDPAPLVRRAMADAFADAADAPRHLIVALANDQSETAAVVLSRSPVLTDADLVDCAALGDEVVQTAIALRRRVSIPVAAALAEIASPVALSALADNPGADIPNSGFRRMLERHGAEAALRESLLNRADLPLDIRQAIAAAVANTLSAFVAECGWLSPERSERVTREAREKTTVVLSANAHDSDVQRLVAHLPQRAIDPGAHVAGHSVVQSDLRRGRSGGVDRIADAAHRQADAGCKKRGFCRLVQAGRAARQLEACLHDGAPGVARGRAR